MDRRVVVAGAFGIDTNVYAQGRQGAETVFADVRDGLGHAGCYSARGFASLEVDVLAIAALGDDPLGRWIRSDLAAVGVDMLELRDPDGTHRSVNLMDAAGNRQNWFDPRSSRVDVLSSLDDLRRRVRGAALAHVQIEDWCRHLLPVLAEEGVVISCDLQDVADLDDAYRADFVAAADVLFLSSSDLDDPSAAVAELAGRRAGRLVVAGLGAEGCLTARDGEVTHHGPVEHPDPVVDTNGAGDNLAVGILTAHVLQGLPLDEAVRRGQLGARIVCSRRGHEKRFANPADLDR